MPRSGWLALGGTLAALLVPSLGTAVPMAAAALVALHVTLLSSIPRGGRRSIVLAVVFGAALIAGRIAVGPSTPASVEAPTGSGPWVMLVESVGSPRQGDQVATLGAVAGDGHEALRLAATMPRYPEVEPGLVVRVTGRPQERPDSPYGRYLARIGAWGTLRVDTLEIVPTPAGPARILEGWRRDAGEALTAVLPEPEAGLAAGILIGLRDRVDREVAGAFTTAGVSHVVAISGWNIAIVAAAIGALAGRLGRRRRAVVTVVAIAADRKSVV